MKIKQATAELTLEEVKAAIAEKYDATDVKLCHRATVDYKTHEINVDIWAWATLQDVDTSDLKPERGAENSDNELSIIKQRLKGVIGEILRECDSIDNESYCNDYNHNCDGCPIKYIDDEESYTQGARDTVKRIAEALGLEVII